MDSRAHANRWLEAWNAHDLDQIMSCYAEMVDFVAPTVVTRWGRTDGRLVGKTELREHFAHGMCGAPLRFPQMGSCKDAEAEHRPDTQAEGAKPALPSAPPEKMSAPIKDR